MNTLSGSLFRKYAIYFVALVCGVLAASGAVSLYFSYQESKQKPPLATEGKGRGRGLAH